MKVRVELSSRDLQIIRALAEGRAAKQIYRDLGICKSRYQQIRAALFDKLGIGQRETVRLIRWAIREGLLKP